MNLEDRLAMSYYDTLGVLDKEHDVYIVQHRSSHKIYVKKDLTIYNKSVFESLQKNPISNIPKIYELYEHDGVLTTIEEYISGDTLEDIIKNNGPFKPEDVSFYFVQLCEIVSKLHKNQPAIIHRDIKPSNIIITPSKSLYLLDLNAGKYQSNNQDTDTHLLGTQGYAAPEQYGFGTSDEHTDIYSLGVVLEQMTYGYHKEPSSRSPLDPVIRKCTEMERSKRYQSVDELASQVRRSIPIQNPKTQAELLLEKKSLLPPGFRSGNFVHMFIAVIGYSLILYYGSMLSIETNYLVMERIFFIFSALYVVGITCNYRNVHQYLPFGKSTNIIVRSISIFLCDMIGVIAIVTIMLLVEEILPAHSIPSLLS